MSRTASHPIVARNTTAASTSQRRIGARLLTPGIRPVSSARGGGPVADLRLLRHADRLERRDPGRVGARVRRRAPRRTAVSLPRARASAGSRRQALLSRGVDRGDARAWRARSRGGRTRALAAELAPVPGGAGRAPPSPRERLEARDPVQHRPRLHRRLAGADRRSVRARDRGFRDRLVQACARPLAGLRARDRPATGRPRRGEPLPRHRSGQRARPHVDLDQPPRRDRRPRADTGALRSHTAARGAGGGRRVSVEIREPRADVAAQIADLLNEHAQAAFGETEIAAAEVRHWFTLPEIWIRVAERDGGLVGYVDAVPRGKDDATELDVRALDPAAAEALLRAGEEHAKTPLLRVVVLGDDPVLRSVVEDAGWRPVRHSYQMRIELGEDPPEPRWPNGISVRALQPDDERRVYEANTLAFEDDWHFRPEPFDRWRDDNFGRENFDHSLSWLAENGEQLAGFSLNGWHFSGDPAFGWVQILGVLPRWRRRGLATALLHQSFREFR